MSDEVDDESAWGNSGTNVDARPDREDGDDADVDDPDDENADDENADDEPSIAAVFGAESEDLPPRPDIVPETPNPENVAFVLLGVLFGLFVIWRAVVVFVP